MLQVRPRLGLGTDTRLQRVSLRFVFGTLIAKKSEMELFVRDSLVTK
jgi:hypothetical protein